MADRDQTQLLVDQVREAVERRHAVAIQGGNSKSFYGRDAGQSNLPSLSTANHIGIVNYQPTELTLTARAGTQLAEIRAALDAAGQVLPFEPPALDASSGQVATLGGTLACGLSGQTRPYAGSCRDYVLGVRVINGRAQHLRFGGEVMKNVAGYDLSRLMVGAFGSLGVITEASLKVLPKPATTRFFVAACSESDALAFTQAKRMNYLPLTGAAWWDGKLQYRLSGSTNAVEACAKQLSTAIGAEEIETDNWSDLNEQELPFFDDSRALWRLAVPSGTPAMSLPGDSLIDWGGQQRWLLSDAPAGDIFAAARAVNGHAMRMKRGDTSVFQDIQPAEHALHRRLKAAFDPELVFNPGRLMEGI